MSRACRPAATWSARVACEMGDKVAAVADVIATARPAVFQSCNPAAVPFALIASTTDPVNPYAGQGGDELTRLASAPETAAFFARHNGCTARAETALPHLDPALVSTVAVVRWSGCRAGAEVVFWRVDGSAHGAPSRSEAGGRVNRDIETAEVLWTFFQAHRGGGEARR